VLAVNCTADVYRVTPAGVNASWPLFPAARRRVQFDHEDSLLRLVTGSANTVFAAFYDLPGVSYARGDVLSIVEMDGEPLPQPLPWHIWRVQWPGWPLPATEGALVRLDVLLQQVTWWRRFTRADIGAIPVPSTDPVRNWVTSFADGGHGAPYQVGSRLGYAAPTRIWVGLLAPAGQAQVLEAGLVDYSAPLLFVEPPVQVAKGDVIASGDGLRYEVGDNTQTLQQHGVTFAQFAQLNEHKLGSYIYQVE